MNEAELSLRYPFAEQGARLRAARKRAGYRTQARLGEAIGRSARMVRNYELGSQPIPRSLQGKLTKLLGENPMTLVDEVEQAIQASGLDLWRQLMVLDEYRQRRREQREQEMGVDRVNDIETVVGVERHAFEHIGRAVSKEQVVYILHPVSCLEARGDDLRACAYSQALERGIEVERWIQNRPVRLRVEEGRLRCFPENMWSGRSG